MNDKKLIIIDVRVTIENIEEKTYFCNKPECQQQFASERSLKKHLCSHEDIPIMQDSEPKVMYRYNCPIKNCRRSLKMESEYFRTRKHLQQHYHKVHNSGKIPCTNDNCDKKFSTEMLRNLHLKNCGKKFPCQCECTFNSSEALLTHQKRKHPLVIRKRKKDKSIKKNNNNYAKVKKSENPPTTREVSTTTSGLGLWDSMENLSFPPNIATTTSVFTSTDQPISSISFESKASQSAPKIIKNCSTSTAEDFIKEENSNSLSSSSSQNKKINWNLTSDFDDVSINIFDNINDVKMEFYSAETQTDFTENLFNNNYTQTSFSDFYDFEKFDIQTQTNWDE